MKLIESIKEFGGYLNRYTHYSVACHCPMTFSVYLPPQAAERAVPALYWLSGLTCTDENFRVKAGAQRYAAEHGIALIIPDTSPRGEGVPDVPERYDLGQGAGFYVDATQAPWAPHFKMWHYVTHELPELVFGNFALDREAQGITGHSMGGHGALTIAMTFPQRYKSVSAFAPIANPSESDWGRKQLTAYLGEDRAAWAGHDATLLMRDKGYPGEVLIDQGSNDQFLDLLKPEALAHAMAARRQPGVFRMQQGYDHSYFFVQTFMGDHIQWHAERLG